MTAPRPWHAIEADPETREKITHAVGLLYSFAATPNGMAVFTSQVSRGRSIVYISPDCFPVADGVIEWYGGDPSGPPKAGDVQLLLGDPEMATALLDRTA